MITNPSVFILGAGASAPYKFPTGTELKNIICKELENKSSNLSIVLGGMYPPSEIEDFRSALKLSGKNSVDAFLEHRTEFIEIGKYAIASILMRYEDLEAMFTIGNWYEYLFNKLNTNFDEFDKNSISFITFNYDRSLDYYLFTALKNSYGRDDLECVSKLKNIPIIHVHGKLGKTIWESEEGRPYNQDNRQPSLYRAATEIKIIHETSVEQDPEFSQARSLLNRANLIYFLGFGFNKINVERLQIPKHKKIKATGFGLETVERSEAEKLFNPRDNRFTMSDNNTDTLLFLRRELVMG